MGLGEWAPFLAAQGIRGRLAGEDVKRQRMLEDEQRQRQGMLDEQAIRRQALQDMLMRGNFERQSAADARAAELHPLQMEDLRAQIMGTGRYAKTPDQSPGFHVIEEEGRQVAVDDAGKLIGTFGKKPKAPPASSVQLVQGVDKEGVPTWFQYDKRNPNDGLQPVKGDGKPKPSLRQELARGSIPPTEAANAEYEKLLAQGGPLSPTEIRAVQNIFKEASGKPLTEIKNLLFTSPALSNRARQMGIDAFEMAYNLGTSRGRSAAQTINEHIVAILSNDTQRQNVLRELYRLAGQSEGGEGSGEPAADAASRLVDEFLKNRKPKGTP